MIKMQRPKARRLAMTLVELIITVIIVGLLSTFAMPAYVRAKQRAVDKEARSQLQLIQAAEKIYRLEAGSYVDCANNADCNAVLRLDLPPGITNRGNWNYSVADATTTAFDAEAAGVKGTVDPWMIDQNDSCAHDGTDPASCIQ